MQYNTIQYNTIQYNTIQYNTTFKFNRHLSSNNFAEDDPKTKREMHQNNMNTRGCIDSFELFRVGQLPAITLTDHKTEAS